MMKNLVRTAITFAIQSIVNSYTLEDFKTKLFWKRPSEGKFFKSLTYRFLRYKRWAWRHKLTWFLRYENSSDAGHEQ